MPHPIRQGDIPGVQLRCDVELPAPAVEVWGWLVDESLAGRWLAESVEIDGDQLMLESPCGDGAPLRERGRTLTREDAALWVLAFERLGDGWESATELRFELSGAGPTTLGVVQRGFERLSLSRCLTIWEFYRRRWGAALERLAGEVRDRSAQL